VPGPFSIEDIHVGRTYRPLSLARYARIGPGRNRFDLPDELLFACWRKKRTGTTDVLGRLVWDRPSVTIRTEFFKPEKGRYLHPEWDVDSATGQNRALTHAEAARLQDFPDDFSWRGSKIEIARQIGNAVPPGLAEQIARQTVLPLVRGTLNAESARPALRPFDAPRGRAMSLVHPHGGATTTKGHLE